jgi:hypothetical protein
MNTDFAVDWRGECIKCGVVISENDATCPVCERVGTLTYMREEHSTKSEDWLKTWHECYWRCEHCGAKAKTLLCPQGDSVVTLPRVSALLPSPAPVGAFLVDFLQLGGAILIPVIGLCTNAPLLFIGSICLACSWCTFVKKRLARFRTRQRWLTYWS